MMIVYIYPVFKYVSWRVIAEKHVEQLKKRYRVFSIDESALPLLDVRFKSIMFLQPYFYPFQFNEKLLARRVKYMHALIGVDVADSDRMSELAVRLTEYSTAMITPSVFARDSYVNSGVRKPVYVVPHGVDAEALDDKRPIVLTGALNHILSLKKNGFKLLLSFIPHSPYRKGYDLLEQIFSRVRKERKDVLLVLRGGEGLILFRDDKTVLKEGWISEEEKDALFRICDLYVHTSRGGGFEHPPLEGLARGLPMIGAKGGSWNDYMPDWAGVDSKPSGYVLEGNPIHIGRGVEILVDRAVDKVLHMLNNLDDYKARAKEYANTVVREKFTWDKIGDKLAEIVEAIW